MCLKKIIYTASKNVYEANCYLNKKLVINILLTFVIILITFSKVSSRFAFKAKCLFVSDIEHIDADRSNELVIDYSAEANSNFDSYRKANSIKA